MPIYIAPDYVLSTQCKASNMQLVKQSYTINLPANSLTFNALDNTEEDRLLSCIIRNSYHVLGPLFPPTLNRRPGLRKRAHPFTLPLKDDKQCIPCVLYRALLPPVQP